MSSLKQPPRLVFVNNIPTPYRIDEFNILNDEAAARGIDFQAVFLSKTAPGRYWSYQPERYRFDHEFAEELTISIRNAPTYFNPRLISRIIRAQPTWLCLAGSWVYPTNILLSWFTALNRHTSTLCLSSRAETDYRIFAASGTYIGNRIKQILTLPYRGWVTPGSRSAEYVRQALDKRNRPILRFPNSVDETLYRDRVAELHRDRTALRARYDLKPEEKAIIWPIRLIPVKNIIPFLEAISPLRDLDYKILIAGDGVLRPEIETWLQDHSTNKVHLLGHLDTEQLLELYAICDLLILPSLSETYGTVVVEAMWAGLPLFISKYVGIAPDVLQPGKTGWLVDPQSQSDMMEKFAEVIATPIDALKIMGQNALALAKEQLDTRKVLAKFLDDLQMYFPPISNLRGRG